MTQSPDRPSLTSIELPGDKNSVELRKSYNRAQPFRHVVLDDFLPEQSVRSILDAFPKPHFVDRILAKLFAARSYDVDLTHVDERIAVLFATLGAPNFIAWLEQLTGISDLQIDPDFIGAGLHQAVNGSSLPIHADHNTLPGNNRLYRRLNLLIYMNPVWDPTWGGVLELWDVNGKAPDVTVVPLLNRCIIMDVHDGAYHGYRRLRLPRGIARNAIVAYYYAPTASPQQSTRPHPTIFPTVGATRRELIAQRIRLALLVRARKAQRFFSPARTRKGQKTSN